MRILLTSQPMQHGFAAIHVLQSMLSVIIEQIVPLHLSSQSITHFYGQTHLLAVPCHWSNGRTLSCFPILPEHSFWVIRRVCATQFLLISSWICLDSSIPPWANVLHLLEITDTCMRINHVLEHISCVSCLYTFSRDDANINLDHQPMFNWHVHKAL